MASSSFTWKSLTGRLFAAVGLLFSTYNPEGYSYYHWALQHLPEFDSVRALAGLLLVIGWTVFLNATLKSLGAFGIALVATFFATLVWLVIEQGWVAADNLRAMTYLIMIAFAGVLTAGVSWSHLRRTLTGQADVDELDG